VEHCQNAKAELQSKILKAIEGAGHDATEEIRLHFRLVLEHLVSLEVRNNEWLNAVRQKLEIERDGLYRSQRSLRQLHCTYGGGLPANTKAR